jgi:hypothetical protein
MSDFSHCPDCSAPLGKERAKCRCGWIKPQAAQVQANPNHTPCAGDEACRYSGRIWVEGIDTSKRLCVEHYYRYVDENRGKAPIEPRIPSRQRA